MKDIEPLPYCMTPEGKRRDSQKFVAGLLSLWAFYVLVFVGLYYLGAWLF